MAALILSGLQLIVTIGVGLLLWRRLDSATREIERLRQALGTAQAAATVTLRRASGAEAVRLAPIEESAPVTPLSITALRRRETVAPTARESSTLSPETVRALALAVLGAAPAVGFFFAAAAPIVATGIVMAAAMMLVALRPLWRAAGWAAVICAAAWTSVGFGLGAASDAPGVFSTALTLAGAAGLAHAHLRRAAPGVTMTLAMGAAALLLGGEIGLVSAAGAAFGVLAALAAIVGAASFRLESVHLAAFGAALIGLFTLSGQHDAAIWFTPATAWVGAVFLGITALRAPELGARGLAIASTGVLASVGAVAALHASRHGLADPLAAAAAFVAVAGALAGVIARGALYDQRGLAGLGLTLWALAGGAFFAFAAAIWIALPSPAAAPAFAACALGLALIDFRRPHAAWRLLGWSACALAAISAFATIAMMLTEARDWPPAALIILGLLLPAAFAGGAAYFAERRPARVTAGLYEAFAILAGVAGANLALRAFAADGALMLAPVGFAEAGLHVAIWLGAALALAARARRGAGKVRHGASFALGAASIAASATGALLWMTPHWTARANALIPFEGLGFLAPAVLLWAHWAFWRARDANMQTRVALGGAALMTAAFVALFTIQARSETAMGTDWLGATMIAVAFALAVGLNFAPGVISANAPTLDFHKDFHRPGRRQAGGEAR